MLKLTHPRTLLAAVSSFALVGCATVEVETDPVVECSMSRITAISVLLSFPFRYLDSPKYHNLFHILSIALPQLVYGPPSVQQNLQ